MHPDDHLCLCFKISLGKIQSYLAREKPQVPSLISECLGAGTGCGWCIPYLKDLHKKHQAGQPTTIESSTSYYQKSRIAYKTTNTQVHHPSPIK